MGTMKRVDLQLLLGNMKPKTKIETSVPNPYQGPQIKDVLIDLPLQLDPMTFGELDVMAVALGKTTKDVSVMAIQLGIIELNNIIKHEMGLED